MTRRPSRAPIAPSPSASPLTKLNTGATMPALGLGLYGLAGDADTEACVNAGLDAGYRAFDTAAVYGNERGLGRALRRGGVPRAELFVTTKVWHEHVRNGRVDEALKASLHRLGLDYVDLFLVHWPVPGRIVPTWHTLEAAHRAGHARAIGVSNHLPSDLDELLGGATIAPAINQVEHHPYLQSPSLVAGCRERGVAVQAWSPLMRGAVLRDPTVCAIAERHRRTPAQVVLRWHLQREVAVVVKSGHPRRMRENLAIGDFTLDADDMVALAKLDRGQRCGPDPRTFTT